MEIFVKAGKFSKKLGRHPKKTKLATLKGVEMEKLCPFLMTNRTYVDEAICQQERCQMWLPKCGQCAFEFLPKGANKCLKILSASSVENVV